MHPHVAIGLTDDDNALILRPIDRNGGQEGYAPEMALFRLNFLGFFHACVLLGGLALRVLAYDHPTVLARYPALVMPPAST
jgi:hypothetical protein